MDVDITRADREDRRRIMALFELYMYDFSEIVDLDVGDDGRFHPPSIDAYFDDEKGAAFLVRVGGSLSGFVLLSWKSRLTGAPDTRDVAELFVMRRYRRRGVGERVAHELFSRFPGRWEVRQKAENTAAIAFWRSTIARFGDGTFDETVYDDERWRGPVQRFTSRSSPPAPRGDQGA